MSVGAEVRRFVGSEVWRFGLREVWRFEEPGVRRLGGDVLVGACVASASKNEYCAHFDGVVAREGWYCVVVSLD